MERLIRLGAPVSAGSPEAGQARILVDARAAERQVRATVMHNPSPKWLEELERRKKAVVPVSGPLRPDPSEGQGLFLS